MARRPQPIHPAIDSLNRLGGLLFSLKFGLVLLVVITAAAIVGTLLPPPSSDISQLEHAQRLVYYNPWFLTLLLLLAANLLLATWRNVMTRVLPSLAPHYMRWPEFYRMTVPGAQLAATDTAQIESALRHAGFRVHREGPYGFAARGQLARWGAPIAHLGVAIVLLAGFASRWTNHEGQITVLEGGRTDTMVVTGDGGERPAPLGFTLICDDFDTAYFPKTRIPSHFVSTVTIMEPGRRQITDRVEVNHSVEAGGWKLHQTSYQEIAQGRRSRLAIGGGGLPTTATLELSPGQRRALPGVAGATLSLSERPPLRWTLERDGKVLDQGDLQEGAGGQPDGSWRVRQLESVPLFSTTISLTRNAAVPVVYAGCALMMLGIVLAFFVRRREVYFWHEAGRGRLHLAAVYRHPRETFDPATQAALDRLRGIEKPPIPLKESPADEVLS